MDTKEKIFKPFYIGNIVIIVALLIGVVYLKYDGQFLEKYSENYVYFLISGLICLLIWQVFNQFRHEYLIKISRNHLHYKNDKIVIDLKDIISYKYIPTISNTPSSFILETKKGEVILKLPNYNRIRLKRISEALTESIKNLQNK